MIRSKAPKLSNQWFVFSIVGSRTPYLFFILFFGRALFPIEPRALPRHLDQQEILSFFSVYKVFLDKLKKKFSKRFEKFENLKRLKGFWTPDHVWFKSEEAFWKKDVFVIKITLQWVNISRVLFFKVLIFSIPRRIFLMIATKLMFFFSKFGE